MRVEWIKYRGKVLAIVEEGEDFRTRGDLCLDCRYNVPGEVEHCPRREDLDQVVGASSLGLAVSRCGEYQRRDDGRYFERGSR
jgi:hypothetical protein